MISSENSDNRLKMEKQLIRVMIRGAREYLSTTRFGYMSFNGISGKERCMKLLQLLEVQDVTERGRPIWPILWALMESTSKRLKGIIIEHIINSGVLSEDIYPRMNIMKCTGESNVKEESLRQLASTMTLYDPRLDNRTKELVKTLDIKDKKIDLTLISRLDCMLI